MFFDITVNGNIFNSFYVCSFAQYPLIMFSSFEYRGTGS